MATVRGTSKRRSRWAIEVVTPADDGDSVCCPVVIGAGARTGKKESTVKQGGAVWMRHAVTTALEL